MNEDMKIGAILALEGVKEELMTVRAELRKDLIIEKDLQQLNHI